MSRGFGRDALCCLWLRGGSAGSDLGAHLAEQHSRRQKATNRPACRRSVDSHSGSSWRSDCFRWLELSSSRRPLPLPRWYLYPGLIHPREPLLLQPRQPPSRSPRTSRRRRRQRRSRPRRTTAWTRWSTPTTPSCWSASRSTTSPRPAASVPELEVDDAAAELTPLPDTDNQTYWLYDYGATDWRTYVGREHALVRAKGTARQYEDVRGEVWWSPPDLCGGLRHATYRRDAGGFVAEVLRAHCHIFRGSLELSCYGPDSENPCAFCISGVSGALIASLVG